MDEYISSPSNLDNPGQTFSRSDAEDPEFQQRLTRLIDWYQPGNFPTILDNLRGIDKDDYSRWLGSPRPASHPDGRGFLDAGARALHRLTEDDVPVFETVRKESARLASPDGNIWVGDMLVKQVGKGKVRGFPPSKLLKEVVKEMDRKRYGLSRMLAFGEKDLAYNLCAPEEIRDIVMINLLQAGDEEYRIGAVALAGVIRLMLIKTFQASSDT